MQTQIHFTPALVGFLSFCIGSKEECKIANVDGGCLDEHAMFTETLAGQECNVCAYVSAWRRSFSSSLNVLLALSMSRNIPPRFAEMTESAKHPPCFPLPLCLVIFPDPLLPQTVSPQSIPHKISRPKRRSISSHTYMADICHGCLRNICISTNG